MATPPTNNQTQQAADAMQARHEAMEQAWAKVAPKADWRAAVDATIRVESDEELAEIFKAVEYFTATKARAVPLCGSKGVRVWHVTAVGYRMGPAGP